MHSHPTERLATRTDNTNPHLKDYVAGHPGYQPYFCLVDIDGDGQRDLMLATVQKAPGPPRFSLYFFRSNASGLGPPIALGHPDPFDDSGIIPIERGVVLGPFYSDAGFIYGWNPATQRLEDITDSVASGD